MTLKIRNKAWRRGSIEDLEEILGASFSVRADPLSSTILLSSQSPCREHRILNSHFPLSSIANSLCIINKTRSMKYPVIFFQAEYIAVILIGEVVIVCAISSCTMIIPFPEAWMMKRSSAHIQRRMALLSHSPLYNSSFQSPSDSYTCFTASIMSQIIVITDKKSS